ncbi:rhamnogalacturonan acetylesterase [Paenibacillus sp. TRM 82003]|nr:rhamnogalacturonan acetylesterase [Paenibacillus sp. TRM 82003]
MTNPEPIQLNRLPSNGTVIYLAADSTVQAYPPDSPQGGWGEYIADRFRPPVRFENRAIGGRSSKSFIVEGRLEAIDRELAPGDYLWVQMGHNDATESKPERYTEPYTDYKRYLKMYLDTARRREATPVLITPVGRLHYEDGIFQNSFPDYCAAMEQVADEEGVPLVDLMERSLAYYRSIGYEAARDLFMVSVNGTDHTHFTPTGARAIANLVADAVRESIPELAAYVLD